jgi:activator of HSP90 ATPase
LLVSCEQVLQRTSKVNAAAHAQQHQHHNRRRSSANATTHTTTAAAAAGSNSSTSNSSGNSSGSCLSHELIAQFSQQWEAVKQREQFHLLSVEAAIDLVGAA